MNQFGEHSLHNKDFFNKIPKVQTTKKLKITFHQNSRHKIQKDKPQIGRKMYAKHRSDKGPESRIHKEFV